LLSERALDHFQNPRNAGELPPPAQRIEVSNPACGDILRLTVTWSPDGRVAAAAFQVRGCSAAIAAGSALTVLIQGRTRGQLLEITEDTLELELGGLAAESRHALRLCIDSLKPLLAG